MDPTLSPAQRHLRDSARDRLAAVPAERHWAALLEIGFAEFTVPIPQGGFGVGEQELCLVFEEAGALSGDPRWMRGLLFALDLWRPARPPHDLGWLLRDVLAGTPQVEACPLLASTPPGPDVGPAGGASHRIEQRPEATAGGPHPERTLSLVDRHGVEAAEVTVSEPQLQAALGRDRIRAAAWSIGVARQATDLARARATGRRLGGKPLVERQAVAHRLARNAVTLAQARFEVWDAAWHEDEASGAAHRSWTALAAAADASVRAARCAVQLHGAAGTSDPQVVGLYALANATVTAWGPAELLWARAVEARFDVGADEHRLTSGAVPEPGSRR